MTKIYYNINASKKGRGGLTESIFTMPFESEEFFKEPEYTNNRFSQVISGSNSIIEYTTIEKCDYVVIPYKWLGYDTLTQALINEAKKYNKKVIALFNDDGYSLQPLSEEDGYMFLTTFTQSDKKTNQRAFPALCGDFYEKYKSYPLTTNLKSVGFCGAITHQIREITLNLLNNSKILKSNFIIRQGFWAPEISDRKISRDEYMKNIKNNCFNVCMRGAGNFSYRLYETMMMGRIPIIINSDQVFPFEDILTYDEFAIMVGSGQLMNIEPIIESWLSNKTTKDLIDIQNQNRKIWVEYMSPPGWLCNFNKEIRLNKEK